MKHDMNNKMVIGKAFRFSYEKANGEVKTYRIIVDRIGEDRFSGRCLNTGRIMNNMKFASLV
jgi:hypothetical protein